jgi:exodeoxyribonuclease V beta subunit
LVFHDASEGLGKILDLNPDPAPENRLQAWKEELAETIRLLYVALTRAKKRCYLVWGRINGAQTSPMLHLFHGNRDSGFEKSPAELLNQKTDEDLLKDLQNLAESSQESIEILPLPCSEKEVLIPIRPAPIKPLLRTFTGNISTEWKITSYSSLVSEGIESEGALEPDSISLPSDIEKDQEKEPFSSDPLSFDIFSFPKGSRSGIFFHKLFETLDYGILPHNQSDEISELINAHGIDMKWKETVIRTAKRILYAPLNGVFGEILLSKIPRSNRIHEMEFYFPLNRITPVLLKSVFAKFHTPLPEGDVSTRIGNLIFSPREGFMKGYMDLVFFHKGRAYLLDWKSNYLGAEIESYGKKQLDQAMKHSYYFLQYYIYTLAVSRYLKLRNPAFNYKTDFGGIFYLFIRGIHPEIEKYAGIYYALPDLADLKALETTLIPASSIYI